MGEKTLVIGANGALGTDLMQRFPHAIPAHHEDFDICDYTAAKRFIEAAGVDTVINTAAFHNVPRCEDEPNQAFAVNAVGAGVIAQICAELDLYLCHISTDYVFDGIKARPYVETDLPGPLNTYAVSKLAGEHMVAAKAKRFSIVRGCGLYGLVPTRAKGGNFITTMIKLGKERDLVSVVDDEWVTPTCTHDLAEGILALIQADGRGVFHLSNSGDTTWYEFAKVIWKQCDLPARLEPTKAAAFQGKVNRPTYSVLSNEKFNRLTKQPLADWQAALVAHIQRMKDAGQV